MLMLHIFSDHQLVKTRYPENTPFIEFYHTNTRKLSVSNIIAPLAQLRYCFKSLIDDKAQKDTMFEYDQ